MSTLPRRFAALRLLLLSAAFVLTACQSVVGTGDRGRLALYLENAAQYYDQAHYERAYHQWDKALEIDPLNDKARLGQGMALYQMGRFEETEAVPRLAAAEERLEELRHEDLDGQEWKAELGYGLVQDRWVQLYDRKIRQLEARRAKTGETDEAELGVAREQLTRRIGLAERSYKSVLGGGEQEAQYQLACLMGLAKMAALRGDYDECLGQARLYEEHVVKSKRLWRDAMERFPKDAPLYEQKLRGAEQQEAELRDVLGNVLFKLGRMEDALAELDTVIDLDTTRASAYLNRGIVRQRLGHWDLARQDLRTFLAMTESGPDDPSVVEASERLAAVEVELDLENRRLGSTR